MAKHVRAIIGWKEWCALPELDLPAIKAKIDTGARTSALHAFDIEPFMKKKISYIRFKIHPLEKNRRFTSICEAPLLENRVVISSNGEREKRPVIITTIAIAGIRMKTELTLTARHQMNFRMLLGRKALRQGRFTVDPAKSFMAGKIEYPDHLYTGS